jgi:hypothetical protein
VLLLLLPLPLSLHAGLIKQWQLKETASAPVLVTGRIRAVHRNERAAEDQAPWKAETWWMSADVEVLRSFAASGVALPSREIEVRFLAYVPDEATSINGFPPPLPDMTPGAIRILPLLENNGPASGPWRLMADSGMDITIPARAEVEGKLASSPSARAFLIGEFVNTLSRGTAGEIAALSGYLLRQREDLSGELMPLLDASIGDDRQQWAEIAASLHAAQSVPRPGVAELLSTKSAELPRDWAGRENLPLIRAALRRLQASPATDDLLIRTWIADAPFNAWGSANSLVEFANSPVTTETLRQALRDDVRGSCYIAMVLANYGNTTILPDAVARAFRVLDDPNGLGSRFDDVQGAAALLRDHGSDQDLTRLAGIVRKYQTADRKYYGALWQYATQSENPREVRVLAVVLADRRVAFGDFRYCDLALGEFKRLTKQKFDIAAASVAERDAEISRALVWISAH